MPRDQRLVRYYLYVDDSGKGHLVAEGDPLPPEGRNAPRWRPTRVLVEAAPDAPEAEIGRTIDAALAEWQRMQAEEKRR